MAKSILTEQSADPTVAIDRAMRMAIRASFGDSFSNTDPLIRVSQNPSFGDYQANCAMGLSKQLKMKPREVAEKIVTNLPTDWHDIAEEPEVAGPGFINIRLKAHSIAHALNAMHTDQLGIEPNPDTHSVAIDLCGVNVAKQMHVGHLRATIIGDSLGRVFERLGRTVHRENHLGDWGLPIAMVLHELRERKVDLDTIILDDLDRAYREAQEHGEEDSSALEAAKATLIKLQSGDADVVRDWKKLIDCTLRALYESLDLLNVKIGPEHNRGESFYRDKLSGIVDAFVREGIAKEDEGALVVPFDDRERPMLIRKSDGGFLYSTTDLAALRYRIQDLGADRVIYVVDARQRDHFRDVFDAIRKIGWDHTADGTPAEIVHVPFGSVLGENRTPLKTRSGENVTLRSLLDEAIDRGTAEVIKRATDPSAPTHGMTDDDLREIGQAVGIAAVKYADLSNDLVRDYVFNLDRMILFEGRTGPYLQYAHARICSIFARGGVGFTDVEHAEFLIQEADEKQLALCLLRYAGVVADVARSLEPHRLCTYLYELAETYNAFYQNCPVLKAENETVRLSRLRLCDLVRRVLADGLALLGIDAPQRM